MTQALLWTIKNNIAWLKNQTVIVGVSGGVDSMALLDCLRQTVGEYAVHIVVAHMEHGFRGQDSIEDAKYVEAYCKKHRIVFEMKSVDMPYIIQHEPDSSQSASRRERYSWYKELTKKYNTSYVILGHHRDDQVETVLMRILQGTSVNGLAGMAPVQERESMIIVRPMLDCSKAEIIRYCEEQRIIPREDASNQDQKYFRNRVRNHLLPILEGEYNRNINQSIVQLAELAREDEEYLENCTKAAYNDIVTVNIENKQYRLERNSLIHLHRALQSRVILLILYYLASDTRFERKHIHLVMDWIQKPVSGGILTLTNEIVIIREATQIVFSYRNVLDNQTINHPVKLEVGKVNMLDDGSWFYMEVMPSSELTDIKTDSCTVLFDADQLAGREIWCRKRRDGDRMSLFGMKGSKKVKNILIDAQIPQHKRSGIPIIATDTDILWLAGVRRSNYAPVTASTINIMYIQYNRQ